MQFPHLSDVCMLKSAQVYPAPCVFVWNLQRYFEVTVYIPPLPPTFLTLQDVFALLWWSHVLLSCPRTRQECYLLPFDMLQRFVGAGDRAELSHCCSRQRSDKISPSLGPGRLSRLRFNPFCRNRWSPSLRREYKESGGGSELSCLFTDPLASKWTVV